MALAVSPEPDPPASASIQVISRAARLLRVLHDEPEGLSLSGLAQRAGLPRSTTHRLLAALEVEGLVAATGPGGRMTLGPELLRIAGFTAEDARSLLHPLMLRLFDELQETVDLAVLVGDHLRFVDQIAAPHRLLAVSAVGDSFPLHCTANGKAVLSALDPAAISELLPTRLPRFTPATITSRRRLFDELETIRERGVAYDHEEHTVGICAVGVVVGDPRTLHGAVTVPMPTQRFAGREREVERALLALAREAGALPAFAG